ncbi:apolipoprotein N-acyltransferase [Nocardioides mesophilus]|uniref:Apolipoprotein N-acyltransferase n=1 Tax=Nocardioides mesophilus TaxID=433659 RepID=A0A7G9RAV0_9ACTN|nr:apolipoprotein N-acyltransferase [Nocardioides mesophilus]QNN52725.1 apolipoprotein N-acyltransferase [Nocardioides mesophilus]
MRSLPARLAVAAVAGVLLALGFEPYAWAYLVPVAVAMLTLVVRGARLRDGFLGGLVFGTAFLLVLLPWLRVIGPDAWVALSLLEALFYGLGGLATAAVTRLRWWPLWSAAVWVAVELLRGSMPFGGFPWGRLAFATIDTPAAPLMAYVGAAGTTFAVALVGTTLAWALLRLRERPVAAVAGLVGSCLLASVASVAPVHAADPAADANPFSVAAVQGDVPGEGMNPFSERRAVLDNHVAATLELARQVKAGKRPAPDLVIWPENSTDIDPFSDPTVYADIQRAVDAIGVPVLVGAMVDGPGPREVYNQGIVWEPGTGPGERYSKRHPVPFGEYIPLREVFAPYITRLDQVPRDMVAGTEPGLLDMNGVTIGDVICFEVAYDDVVRDVAGDARVLVVQTNNATYMGTGQVEQQFAISRLRAIETGLPVVVAATNGISGIVAPDGEVLAQAPVRTRTVLSESLTGLAGGSWGLRTGPWVQALLVLVAAVCTVRGAGLGYRQRSPGVGVRETQGTGVA